MLIVTVPFLNNLVLSWHSVKMAHCGGFVRKPRKRLESTQCSCAPACCGDGVLLLLYQGACCLGLLVLKFKCTARPPYYLPLRHIAVNDHDILIIRETGRPVHYSLWTACLRVSLIDLKYKLAQSDVDQRIFNEFSHFFVLFLDITLISEKPMEFVIF